MTKYYHEEYNRELSKPTNTNSLLQNPLLLEKLAEKRPLRESLLEEREDWDSQQAAPDMKTWLTKKEPSYIPLRKEQLSGRFVGVDIESNEGDGEFFKDSEMMWIEDAKDDLRLDTVEGLRKEFRWSNKNRIRSRQM